VLAAQRKKVLSRRTFTSSSFFSLSMRCESVEFSLNSQVIKIRCSYPAILAMRIPERNRNMRIP
jgi:hypothetical protein